MHRENVRNAMAVRRWPTLRRHVDEEDKTNVAICDTGSNYKSQAVLVNESGLCSLILSSQLPQKIPPENKRKQACFGRKCLAVLKIFRIFVG